MKQATKSLNSRNALLAHAKNQVEFLENGIFGQDKLPTFSRTLGSIEIGLRPTTLQTLQANLGYKCNQTCTHCHVDAGPDRKEVMTRDTMLDCLEVMRTNGIRTLDITGGAPELNPDFRWFVEQSAPLVEEIIVRSNLTIIESHNRFHDLPEFFKSNRVRVISSLPCYTESNVDRQRGVGVFNSSTKALKRLNDAGYGIEPELKLDLVYNPGGPHLAGDQSGLENAYKIRLDRDFGIQFNELLTLNNLPIARFLDSLIADGSYEEYMNLLVNSFNPSTVEGLMCRNTLSVSWDGDLFDCDFNQMLEIPIDLNSSASISNFSIKEWNSRSIRTSQHCYGCTAGQGSSCQGSLV